MLTRRFPQQIDNHHRGHVLTKNGSSVSWTHDRQVVNWIYPMIDDSKFVGFD